MHGYRRTVRVNGRAGALLAKVECKKAASGAKTDRGQRRKALAGLEAGDVLMVTRLDRLAPLDLSSVGYACCGH
jgi:DNA invertase Pin-like site-specific DNA recombinase